MSSAIIRSVSRLMISVGMSYGDLQEIARVEYCRAAAERLTADGQRASCSRISILSGLSRADVSRILKKTELCGSQPHYRVRTDRVLHGWISDPTFTGRDGAPRVLKKKGPGSFEELCKKFSGDVPPRALLEALLLRGDVVAIDSDTIRIEKRRGAQDVDINIDDAVDDLTLHARVHFEKDPETRRTKIESRFVSTAVPTYVVSICRQRVDRFLSALSDFIHAESVAHYSEGLSQIPADERSCISFTMIEEVSGQSPSDTV